MQVKTTIFAILYLILCNVKINGQETYFTKTFTTANGLPHNHVRGIAQDSTGFLWVATWDGISRYDGYEFRNYYHNPTDSNSLAYFICDNVIVDFQNNVWIYGGNGISKYNRETDNFIQFEYLLVGGIATDKEGKLWCNTNVGLQRWDYQLNKFVLIEIEEENLPKDWRKTVPSYITFDNENHLWFCSYYEEKLWLFRCHQIIENKLTPEFIGTLDNHKYFPEVNSMILKFEITVNSDNDYRFFSNMNVFRYNSFEKEFLPVVENSDTVKSQVVREAYNRQTKYNTEISGKKSGLVNNTSITETFFLDKQNILWQSIIVSGSTQTGLTRNIQTPRGFKHYFTELNPNNGLNAFFPVLKDKYGTVWGGATNINKIFLKAKDGNESQINPIDEDTWKLAFRPRALLEDSTGVWIGYFQKLLTYYRFNTNRFTNIILKRTGIEDSSLPHNFVHLKKLGDDLLIVGFKDIYKYNTKTKELIKVKTFERKGDLNLYCITPDPEFGWWIGGSLGRIFRFDNDFNEIGVYSLAKGLFNVEDIVAGDNNDLWISLLGAGLGHFDKATGKSKIYTTADGLSNNTCYGMQKDNKGNIWVSTNRGISRFNPKSGRFRIFGPEDGLKIEEFNSDNTFLAKDGEMFFGGMGGVVSFYPDSVDVDKTEQFNSPLLITDFKVSGASRYFKKAIYESDSVTLKKGENNFRVDFASIDFANAEKIKYRYRLAGKNNEFAETDFRNRSVNYSNLSPGNYHLEIEATNLNGDWISKTFLFIKIPPYYYQTLTFRILLVLLIAGIIGYFMFSHNQQIRMKARQQQYELKLESLRGQMNPHFIFNSLNSINYFISQNDRLAANRYIADFARLIRSILGNLSQEYIPLSKELESINDYLQLEHLRFGDKFDYEVVLDDTISTDNFLVFPGMVQPFIENAIWHGVRSLEGRKGFVKISFYKQKPDALFCSVEDDGVGRKLADARKSNLPGKTSRGIGIVVERIKIINHLRQTHYEVKIEDLFNDRKETGTHVTIEIPAKS